MNHTNTQCFDWNSAGIRRPYNHLVGREAARSLLPTPALLIDHDALTRNIERMARFARTSGIRLRPHVKTHKCIDIARLQLAAGAVGVSCATLDELEVMANSGVRGLLMTSPLVTPDKLKRFSEVLRQAPDTMLVVDHPEAASALATHAGASGVKASVLLDLDMGYHRSGVRTAVQIENVVRAVVEAPELELVGVQAYSGDIQHIVSRTDRAIVVRTQETFLRAVIESLTHRLDRELIVSGGGTGTHRLEVDEGIMTEIQPGSYVFMDADYARIELGLRGPDAFENALFLRASVSGVNCSDAEFPDPFVTIDAGTKSFALNGPLPRCVTSPWQNTGFRFMGDEHGHLLASTTESLPTLGTGLEFVVPHCDPTVQHFDHYYVMQGQTLMDVWAVHARGRR